MYEPLGSLCAKCYDYLEWWCDDFRECFPYLNEGRRTFLKRSLHRRHSVTRICSTDANHPGSPAIPTRRQSLLRSPAGSTRRRCFGSTTTIASVKVSRDPERSLTNFYEATNVMLGAGAFGQVWKMKHKTSNETRAVKVIFKDKVAKDMSMVVNELLMLVELDHPNVLKFWEYFETETTVFIVTDLAVGGDLSALVPEAGTVGNELEGLEPFRQMMSAVSYCHSMGVAHRDLKLANCLFYDVERSLLKVIDFGLARIKKPGERKETWIKQAAGTAEYMSPEALKGATGSCGYGVETDIWSAGVILFMLITGEHPYGIGTDTHEEFEEILNLYTNTNFNEEALEAAQASLEAQNLIHKMLCVNIADRITAKDVLDDPLLMEQDDGEDHVLPPSEVWVRRLAKFSQSSRFEQALWTCLAYESHASDLVALRKAFEQLDKDHNGRLNKEEVRAALQAVNASEAEEIVSAIWEIHDVVVEGELPFSTWLASMIKPRALASETATLAAFQFFDQDGDGKLSEQDLQSFVDAKEAHDVVMRCHSDSGFLDFKQFYNLVQAMAKPSRRSLLFVTNDDSMPDFVHRALHRASWHHE